MLKKRATVIILGLVVVFMSTLWMCSKVDENQVPEGFTSLFNGKDLTGWKVFVESSGKSHTGGKWTVEEGNIIGVQDPPGQGGFLTTLQKYRDFEIRLETKIDWPFDSGVFLRVGPESRKNSYQVTLDYRSKGEVGAIFVPGHGFSQHCVDGVNSFKKDEWNDVRIICEGEPAHIKVWINDTLLTDFQQSVEDTSDIAEDGTICLQVHPGGKGYEKSRAMFRNIFIRTL